MDDWQQTQQTTRHLHNRNNKGTSRRNGGGGGGSSSGKSNRPFDVHRTFGTYEIKCPAADKLSSRDSSSDRDRERGGSSGGSKGWGSLSRLEIYTLTERGNAVVGELMLGGVVHATVLLAGSRKVMGRVVRALEEGDEDGDGEDGEGEGEGKEKAGEVTNGAGEEGTVRLGGGEANYDDNGGEESTDDEEEVEEDDEDDDSTTNHRIREFEKNSFRSPKFWLKWQGSFLSHATSSGSDSTISDQTVTSTGYLVFSGNQCDKFQGTISCEPLDWNNVKISGWKIKSQSARDFAMTWTR